MFESCFERVSLADQIYNYILKYKNILHSFDISICFIETKVLDDELPYVGWIGFAFTHINSNPGKVPVLFEGKS